MLNDEYNDTIEINEYEESSEETTSTLVSNIVNIEQQTKPLDYVKNIVKSWCNEELWPYLKFVDTNQMLKLNLEEDNHLFQTLFIRININNNNINAKHVFLKTYSDTIKKTINEYRATSQDKYKKDILKCK